MRIGKVTGKDSAASRLVLDRFGSLGHNLTLVRGENAADAGDDLVRILMELTGDVERFDSMVVHQRKMLDQQALCAGAIDDDQIGRQSEQLCVEAAERLSVEAAEMLACAREALARLRTMSETAKVRVGA